MVPPGAKRIRFGFGALLRRLALTLKLSTDESRMPKRRQKAQNHPRPDLVMLRSSYITAGKMTRLNNIEVHQVSPAALDGFYVVDATLNRDDACLRWIDERTCCDCAKPLSRRAWFRFGRKTRLSFWVDCRHFVLHPICDSCGPPIPNPTKKKIEPKQSLNVSENLKALPPSDIEEADDDSTMSLKGLLECPCRICDPEGLLRPREKNIDDNEEN